MKKALYTLLLMAFFAPNVYASHFKGGDLRYEFNGTNYTVILTMYGDCRGVGLPINTPVDIVSNSLNDSVRIVLPRVSMDTVKPSCPNRTTTCYNPSSVYPGTVITRYMDTTSVPMNVASDWMFYYSSGARISLSNVAAGLNSSISLQASLNNINSHNSSPYIPNSQPFFITGTSTIPIQTLDSDDDSIAYERIAPLVGKNISATYAPGGYSAITPFGTGGTYTINAVNQTVTLSGTNVGNYALAFLVKEYRNGNLIGSYIRDFTASNFPGSPLSYPRLSFNSFTTVYACPSAADSSIIWFTDPTITDTVSVVVKTPTIPGWSFGSSTTTGIPTATAEAWWTAPSTLNPSTLPFFYIDYCVVDSGCPSAMVNYAVLVKTRLCNADSVWPGDANSDKVVNLLDPLAIALAFNQTGPARAGATTNWVAQAATDWNGNINLTPVNKKHADCNGNGTVNLADLGAVIINYGKTHPKGGASNKITGAPEVFFDLNGIILRAGDNVSVPIKMGALSNQVFNVYGIASRIKISETPPTTQSSISTTDSWLGTSANTLTFEKDIELGVIDWAHARTDHTNANGTGTIGTLSYTVPATAKPGDSVRFSFENTTIINKDGDLITNYNTIDAVGIIQFPVAINNVSSSLQNAAVVPNPSSNSANLYVQLAQKEELVISVVDVTGKTIWSDSYFANEGQSQILLPAVQIASGVYFINIQGANGFSDKVKWVKR